MKHISKLLCSFVIVIAFVFSLNSICFAANEIDFDTYTEGFSSNAFNTFSLETGAMHTPQAAIWLSVQGSTAASSDTAVVTVSETGDVTAVGEGSAYVVYIGTGGMSEVYRYDVSSESVDVKEQLSDKKGLFNIFGDFSTFKIMIIPMILFLVFFVVAFSLSVTTVSKVHRIKTFLSQLSMNPCQQTANKFVNALKLNKMQRYIIMHSHEYKGGVSKHDCVDVYMNIVLPCAEIDEDTKNKMRNRLASIGCVFTRPDI